MHNKPQRNIFQKRNEISYTYTAYASDARKTMKMLITASRIIFK